MDIIVEEGETPHDFGHGVTVAMPRADAVRLFHDLNRMLAIIDDEVPELPDAADQGAYDRASAFLATVQRELRIGPERA